MKMTAAKLRKVRKKIRHGCSYILLSVIGIIFIYPLLFMFFASFKSNAEIMGSMSLLPSHISFENYISGWRSAGQYTFGHYIKNTLLITVPVVALTILSSSIVGYGFARFRFKGHKLLFGAMLSTMMLPNAVVIVPRYILFNKFGWLNTYIPFYAPAMLACSSFFIFSMVQFIRGIPRSLDDAAFVDGCSTLGIFIRIILPLSKPCLTSMAVFQFIWSWNDYFNPLIFINSVSKYNVMQGLKLGMDATSGIIWGPIMAMSAISIIPCVIIFFCSQKYFAEGIATSGIKG